MFADWLNASGLAVAKPLLTTLVLPPTPFIVLALLGGWRARRARRGAWPLLVAACAGLWILSCDGAAAWLQASLLRPPAPLAAAGRSALKARAASGETIAIVVLGGGVERAAPEYGADSLLWPSLERLRYGVWLGRETGLPVAFSGGAGWAVRAGTPVAEAEVAARVAAQEFGAPLRWTESTSRDTHENATHTVALLAGQGVRTIVLVTHAWHMPRALLEFRAAAARQAPPIAVEAAPIGLAPPSLFPTLDWFPSGDGTLHVRVVLREALGRMMAGR